MRRGPTRVNFRHPVVDLSHGMVGIAGAGPVAQWHRCRDAGLARIDDSTILRREPAQIQKVHFETSVPGDDFFGYFRQTKSFRHFSRTGLVAAGGAVDEKNVRIGFGTVLTLFRLLDGAARFEPFDGQWKVRIAEAWSCPALAWVPMVLGVIFPRHGNSFFDFRSDCVEGRIIEPLAGTFGKFLFR